METEHPTRWKAAAATPYRPRLNMSARSVDEDVLPLTAFERFLWLCEQPETPMVIRVCFYLRGTIDREKMTRAFDATVARHPLLTAVLKEHRGSTAWVPGHQIPQLKWHESNLPLDELPQTRHVDPIDPTREPSVRAEATQTSDGVMWLLDVHHCAADGGGVRQFLLEWLHHYDREVRNSEPALVKLEPERLAERGVFHTPGVREPVSLKDGIRNFYVTVKGRTARLPRRTDRMPVTGKDATHATAFAYSKEATTEIREVLKSAGITINDLFVSASMVALAKQFPDLPAHHYVTLLNPVDMRLPSDRRTPAANRFGVAFLRRQLSNCTDIGSILTGLRDELTYIKREHVGAEFVRGLANADRLPGLVRLLFRIGVFSPTLQFTCLGEVTRTPGSMLPIVDGEPRPGGLLLDFVAGYAPVPPNVPICVAACETRSRLMVTVRAADRYLSAADADVFQQALLSQVDGFIRDHSGDGMESSDA